MDSTTLTLFQYLHKHPDGVDLLTLSTLFKIMPDQIQDKLINCPYVYIDRYNGNVPVWAAPVVPPHWPR